ncbi:MAG: nuclear transport factor 2 family protein [Sphingorhabdus sp.]
MTNPAIDIPNLLYLYADAIDGARFDEAAALFDHGHIEFGDIEIRGREAIAAMWRDWIRLYDCGTPRTRHIISNPIIELAPDGLTASCRSQWTVIQAAPGFALQIVASGRYHDRFALIDKAWVFTKRNYARTDLAGDSSAHTLHPLIETGR